MRLLLARHGATQNNFDARFTGQTDIPLSPLGERQAHALARRLAEDRPGRLVSSDLQRASRTADIVAAAVGLPVELDRDLREIALGAWEGRTHAELEAEAPEELRRWRRDALTWAPPGGETYAALRDRLRRALWRWHDAEPQGTVLWVTHGAAIGVLLCDVLGIELTRGWQFRRDNAAISELDVGAERIVVVRLNDAAHLAGVAEGERAEKFQVM